MFTDQALKTLLFTSVVYLVIWVLFFLLIRWILLWYWKVNIIVKNQEETNSLLQELIYKLETQSIRQKENG
jgi:predicted permease